MVAAEHTTDQLDVADILPAVPKNVGHLLKEPSAIDCPACHQATETRIERQAVTCLQRFVAVLNWCLCCNPIRWSGRHDVNHYCSKCGCYIGRHITPSWYKRQLFRLQRYEIDEANRWQRFRTVEKEQLGKRKQQQEEQLRQMRQNKERENV